MMGRFVTAVISLVPFALSGDAGNAKPKFPPDEKLIVPSLTLTDEQFLKGKTADEVSGGRLTVVGVPTHLELPLILPAHHD